MDKYALIEKKISDYFTKKSQKYGGLITDFKLIISYDGKLRYELYGVNNLFCGYKKLDDILNVSMFESMAIKMMKNPISAQTVEKTLFETIQKIAKEQNAEEKQIQLLLLPNKQYGALLARKKIRDINLTEIL
jgi:hypothetical protein